MPQLMFLGTIATEKQVPRGRDRRNASEIIYPQESHSIVGACFEVYNEMGSGFLESVYQECLTIELSQRKIPYQSQVELQLVYKSQPLHQQYRPDFLCYDKIILEIKSIKELTELHLAQVHNYLRATSLRLGLLINFSHHPQLDYRRIVY